MSRETGPKNPDAVVDLFASTDQFELAALPGDGIIILRNYDETELAFKKMGDSLLFQTVDSTGYEHLFPARIMGSSPTRDRSRKPEHPSVIRDSFLHFTVTFDVRSGTPDPSWLSPRAIPEQLPPDVFYANLRKGTIKQTEDGRYFWHIRAQHPPFGPLLSAAFRSAKI